MTSRIRLPFVAFLILVWIYSMPMVSCHSKDKQFNVAQEQEQQHQQKQKHLQNNNNDNDNNKIHLTQLHNQNEKNQPNLFEGQQKQHHEILEEWSMGDVTSENGNNDNKFKTTKKFRKGYKNKVKQQNKNKYQQQKDNKVKSSVENLKYIQSDKKYFDYFPAEKIDLNINGTEDDIDQNIKVVFLLNDNDDNDNDKNKNNEYNHHHHNHHNQHNHKKHQNKKKLKKYSTNDMITNDKFNGQSINSRVHSREKRNAVDLSLPELDQQIHHQQNLNIGNVQKRFIPNFSNNNLIRKIRDKPEESGRYLTYGTPYDPWNNQFLRSSLNGYRHPVEISRSYSRVPFIKYPIAGIYYNPISPPGKYQPNRPLTGTQLPSGGDEPESIGDRFGEDRVIWEIKYTKGTPSITAAQSPPVINSSTRRPLSSVNTDSTTRRPPPPLIHPPIDNPIEPLSNPPRTSSNTFGRETTRVPPSFSVNNAITEPPPRPLQGAQPATSRPSPTRRSQPSKCVWAIVNCCARDNLTIRYNCFEQVGCSGAFWDLNPCATEVQDAALSLAESYFNN